MPDNTLADVHFIDIVEAETELLLDGPDAAEILMVFKNYCSEYDEFYPDAGEKMSIEEWRNIIGTKNNEEINILAKEAAKFKKYIDLIKVIYAPYEDMEYIPYGELLQLKEQFLASQEILFCGTGIRPKSKKNKK